MNLAVRPPCGPGLIPTHGGVFQEIFPWLITLCHPLLSQYGREWLNLPSINGTTQPASSEEEGRISTMDRQWLKSEIRTCSTSAKCHYTLRVQTCNNSGSAGTQLHQLVFYFTELEEAGKSLLYKTLLPFLIQALKKPEPKVLASAIIASRIEFSRLGIQDPGRLNPVHCCQGTLYR